jgi:selenocysteine lyase/cysteine desulfurase
VELAAAQALWEPDGPYLNTASYGLPPRPAWDALQAALEDWHHGRTSWEHWGRSTEASRAAFARLTGVAAEHVATGATVSGLVSLVAAALPERAKVVVAEGEFTSLIFPFMVRGLDVVAVPLPDLPDAVDARTALVAFSAVQSASGELAPIDDLVAAAAAHGAQTAVDATQACGWLPLDASRFDYVACAAYKWLMSPRGTAFMAVAPERLESVPPLAAGWYAGEDVHASYYGPPMQLARGTRRLDTSPAWFSWVGTQPALELIEQIGVQAIHDHDVALANRFRAGLGLPPGNSAIVSADVPDAAARLERAGIRAAVRAGGLRASFHVYNTETDVDGVLDVLSGP